MSGSSGDHSFRASQVRGLHGYHPVQAFSKEWGTRYLTGLTDKMVVRLFGIRNELYGIPGTYLGPFPIAGDEEVHVAREGITLETLADEAIEAVEALAHVGRLAVREDPDGAGGADHPRTRSKAARCSNSRPSTTKPRGVSRRTPKASRPCSSCPAGTMATCLKALPLPGASRIHRERVA